MSVKLNRDTSSGTALVEVAVAVLVLAVIVAAGVYVMNHRAASNPDTSTNTTAAAQPGTTASIDQLTQSDAIREQQVYSSAAAQAQQDALSANTAASNVGGAYNESTL